MIATTANVVSRLSCQLSGAGFRDSCKFNGFFPHKPNYGKDSGPTQQRESNVRANVPAKKRDLRRAY